MPPSCRGGPGPLVIVPVVVFLVRSNVDTKALIAGNGSSSTITGNAHKLIQMALARLPSGVLYWFCKQVLNLPSETAMSTTEFLKSKRAGDEVWTDWDQLGSVKESSEAPQDRELEVVLSPGIEQRIARLEVSFQRLEEQDIPRLLEYSGGHATENEPETAVSLEMVNQDATAIVAEYADHGATGNASSSGVIALRSDAQKVAQELGLRLGQIFIDWAGDMMKQALDSASTSFFEGRTMRRERQETFRMRRFATLSAR